MAGKTVKARVLVAFSHEGVAYRPDQVIELDASLVKNLEGQIDTAPEAVKHCMDQGADVIKLK